MCNHERLLDYVYDELPAPARADVERHLRECAACQAELAGLSGTRLALASWSPPDAELGFSVVRKPAAAPRRNIFAYRPAWGLAAAAVLLFAVAAAVANLEVRYDNNGFIVRTGWAKAPQSAPAAPASAVNVATTSEEWKASLQQLDARLKQIEGRERTVSAAVHGSDESSPAQPAAERLSDADVRMVRRIVDAALAESEARQRRELALRVAQVIRDVDSTRAGDLARIEQGLRQIQGLTDAELIRHRDTLNHLLRVTQQR